MTIDTEPAAAGEMMITCSLTCANSGSRGRSGRGKAPLRLLCLATAVLAVAILAPIGTASAQEGLRFRADASPDQEVPPPEDSDGSGTGRFTFERDLSELAARVDVEELTSEVAAAHLHCGLAGVNGPIVVNLFPTTGVTEGRIVDDDFDNEDVILEDECFELCGFDILNIASLRQAAADACLYLNVHTEEFPDGEVRGQLLAR